MWWGPDWVKMAHQAQNTVYTHSLLTYPTILYSKAEHITYVEIPAIVLATINTPSSHTKMPILPNSPLVLCGLINRNTMTSEGSKGGHKPFCFVVFFLFPSLPKTPCSYPFRNLMFFVVFFKMLIFILHCVRRALKKKHGYVNIATKQKTKQNTWVCDMQAWTLWYRYSSNFIVHIMANYLIVFRYFFALRAYLLHNNLPFSLPSILVLYTTPGPSVFVTNKVIVLDGSQRQFSLEQRWGNRLFCSAE